eukprot:jgi/Botrbrau1/9382/Bobra.0252s0008.1
MRLNCTGQCRPDLTIGMSGTLTTPLLVHSAVPMYRNVHPVAPCLCPLFLDGYMGVRVHSPPLLSL